MTVRVLTTCLMAGAMAAVLVPAAVVAQQAAQKAAAPAAKAAPAKTAAAPAKAEIPGKETPKLYKGFVPTRNAFGQPDLSGAWQNGSLTQLTANMGPTGYNGRLVLTADEVADMEGTEKQNRINGDKPTPTSFTVADLPTNCGNGFSGVGCGYNGGFVDPGSTVARVHGEPRVAYVTYPTPGVIPAPKATSQAAVVVGLVEGQADAAPGAGRGGGAPGAAAGGGRGGPPGAAAGGRGGAAAVAAAAGGRGGAGRGPDNTNAETRGGAERCLTSFGRSAGPIMQSQLYNNNYRIQQGRDSVAIWIEMVHEVRTVRLNSTHLPSSIRPWFGDAIGRYEGNTLVVETTNWHPSNNVGGRSAADLTLTERFTKVAKDRLLYQFNVHSPANWDVDWGGEYEFQASDGIYEYACHEGNYALEGILAGNLAVATGGAPTPRPFTPR